MHPFAAAEMRTRPPVSAGLVCAPPIRQRTDTMPKRQVRPDLPAQYAVWLLPEPAIEQVLVETVTRLSVLLGGPGFAPHVTVQGEIALPLELLTGAVQRWAESCPPLCWSVADVEGSAHFFRSLYLRFNASAAFTALQAFAHSSTETSRGLSPFPHMSLAYGDSQEDNLGLRKVLSDEFVGQAVVFDQLAIYRASKRVPVPEWECLARFPLDSA